MLERAGFTDPSVAVVTNEEEIILVQRVALSTSESRNRLKFRSESCCMALSVGSLGERGGGTFALARWSCKPFVTVFTEKVCCRSMSKSITSSPIPSEKLFSDMNIGVQGVDCVAIPGGIEVDAPAGSRSDGPTSKKLMSSKNPSFSESNASEDAEVKVKAWSVSNGVSVMESTMPAVFDVCVSFEVAVPGLCNCQFLSFGHNIVSTVLISVATFARKDRTEEVGPSPSSSVFAVSAHCLS